MKNKDSEVNKMTILWTHKGIMGRANKILETFQH